MSMMYLLSMGIMSYVSWYHSVNSAPRSSCSINICEMQYREAPQRSGPVRRRVWLPCCGGKGETIRRNEWKVVVVRGESRGRGLGTAVQIQRQGVRDLTVDLLRSLCRGRRTVGECVTGLQRGGELHVGDLTGGARGPVLAPPLTSSVSLGKLFPYLRSQVLICKKE